MARGTEWATAVCPNDLISTEEGAPLVTVIELYFYDKELCADGIVTGGRKAAAGQRIRGETRGGTCLAARNRGHGRARHPLWGRTTCGAACPTGSSTRRLPARFAGLSGRLEKRGGGAVSAWVRSPFARPVRHPTMTATKHGRQGVHDEGSLNSLLLSAPPRPENKPIDNRPKHSRGEG